VTTIAVKDGCIAADSRVTLQTEAGGSRMFLCEKLYHRKFMIGEVEHEAIIALGGDSFPGLVFLDWFGSGKEPPEVLITGEADFTALVLRREGLFEYDKWCRGDKILNPYYAVGSGAKAAMGAMAAGASAKRAVEIACEIDPYSGIPVVVMHQPGYIPKKKSKK
jgi:hypothetical protein